MFLRGGECVYYELVCLGVWKILLNVVNIYPFQQQEKSSQDQQRMKQKSPRREI